MLDRLRLRAQRTGQALSEALQFAAPVAAPPTNPLGPAQPAPVAPAMPGVGQPQPALPVSQMYPMQPGMPQMPPGQPMPIRQPVGPLQAAGFARGGYVNRKALQKRFACV